jgi:flagellar biosynthesis anti-sigma factor FlgM
MKIDSKILTTPNTQPDPRVANAQSRALTQSSAKTSGVSPASREDTVSLSGAHTQIQKLAAGVADVPEVRTARVSALQQQVSQGQYQPKAQDIAEAMLTELHGINVKA